MDHIRSLSNNPSKAWNKLKSSQNKRKMTLQNFQIPKCQGTIRFVIISDTHCRHRKINVADGDVLLHCGDFSFFSNTNPHDFDSFLGTLPHPIKIVIAGNHDYDVFNLYKKIYEFKNCIYLQDTATTALGYKIYGTPWAPIHSGGAFMLSRGAKLRDKWCKIPSDTEILMTHTPPIGYGDRIQSNQHVGDVDLLLEVQERIQPILHAFGHIHEG